MFSEKPFSRLPTDRSCRRPAWCRARCTNFLIGRIMPRTQADQADKRRNVRARYDLTPRTKSDYAKYIFPGVDLWWCHTGTIQPTNAAQRVAEKHTCTCALDMEQPHSTSGAFFAHYSPSAPLTDNPSLLNRSLLYILRINFTRSGLEFLVPMRSLAACQVNEK